MIQKENNVLGKILIHLNVNNKDYELLVDPGRTLVEVLREDLQMTGTKQGCETANCGACTVIANGMAIKSCNTLAVQMDGYYITTIEGLSRFENGEETLHPLQKAFIEQGAIQCGFCTAGMIMSAKALLDTCPDADEDTIREAMHGNICRCTGYVKVVQAIESARDAMKGAAK